MSPAAREIAIRRWSLEMGEPLSGGHRSDVYAVRRPGGFAAAVLKVCASTRDAADEAAALGAWAPWEVAVRLLDADLRAGALLIERLVPGTPLPPGESGPATDVLAALHGTPLPEYAFREQAGSFAEHDREVRADLIHERRARSEPDRAREAERLLPSAGRLMEGLAATAHRRVLLHGDFLTKNLLASGDGYGVVDPMPRLGDPAADVGMFAHDQPTASILDTAAELADAMSLDVDRAVSWAVVWTVMVTVQAWRDDQADLDALVGLGVVPAVAGRLVADRVAQRPDPFRWSGSPGRRPRAAGVLLAAAAPQLGQAAAATCRAGAQQVAGLRRRSRGRRRRPSSGKVQCIATAGPGRSAPR